MGRREFLAHLDKLSSDCAIKNVSGVRRGEDDMFYFRVDVPVSPEVQERVEIAAMIVPGKSFYNTSTLILSL
jgi:hypothetical protein